ncbi:MATH and LRR domain-containing protein PFE0570w-like [Metopolophium dirhodum]|uniref:MATH and LRR domain-containing protein PFE0570w-like n=1 Tax=Metopolophium dirhodum TaxID=44670 RepID=UPI0029902C37|nr:MATH and LRR domain-containing protein PFE0570w-like [Metopolophium dirhodum]
MNTSNNVHNESFKNKTPKKKMYDGSSIELNTYTEENTCEKDIEKNITDSYSRKNVNQKGKSEINTLANISLGNNCSMDNENVLTKKPKKKRNHNKSLNLIHANTNHDTEIFNRMCVEVNEQTVNDSDYRENVNQIVKSELNALSDITLENKCSMDNDNVATKKPKKKKKHKTSLSSIEINTYNDADYRIYKKDNKHNINDPESAENITKIKMSEINALTNKKPKKKKKHNKSLNTTTEAAIKSFDRTFVEVNEQNIIDSYSRKNVSRKRKSEINALADISLGDSCSIDYENVPIKKTKKKKNHDESLSTEFNTNHDTKIQIIERTYEVVNDQNINNFDFRENVNRTIKSELNTSSEISSENKCSMDYDNVAIKKPKKKKNHVKSLNSIEINTYNDAVNDSDNTKNISQKRMSEINALPTKTLKKKKNVNLIEFNTNHDTEVQIFERTYDEINDSYYRESVNQITKPELNTSSDILSENKLSIDDDNVATKKPKKKKKHNKSLNSIELNTNNDAHFRTFEKNNDHIINDSDSTENISQKRMSEMNALADISLGNDFSNDNERVPTKMPKKKKIHNKSLNSIELNTNNDAHFRTFEKNNDHIIDDSDSTENISQKRMSEMNALADISLENDSESVPTKIPKKKKNHNKSLNSIELNTNNDSDSTTHTSQKRMSEMNALADISLGNGFSNDNESVPTKISKKKKNHNKSLNSIELNTITINDAHFRTFEKNNNHNINDSDSTEKRMSEINALPDISLRNDFNNDNENVPTKKPKKKKIHNEPNMNNSDTKALASASLEINYSLDNEHLVTKESEKMKKHDKITNNLSMPMISQSQSRLKTLLNSMELYHSEESSTNSTNLNLKRFNLMKYLTNKDPSLKNHPNFKQINEHLSKKIKLTINKKCELKASDILLLKTIGKIILKKIVEKIDSAQDIKDLVIKLPPECMENKIHFIETTLSRLPNKSKMDIIKKHNPLIKLRVFNKDEDNIIREYWSRFQKEYNISNILPFLSNGLEIALSPTERLQFIRYISAGLPNRLLYSVFNRFNILFNEYQDKTGFSEEEDQLIIKVDKCDAIKNKFSVLSLILNRTRLQLYRRHEVLKNQHKECEKFMWDDKKRQELLTNILLETNTEHWTHLKDMIITKDILIKIAKNLGKNITYNKVRYQWNYLYTMLFCEKPILTSTFNLTVLELLEQINPKHWSDLNWIEITNKLYPGAKSKVICSFFHSWIDKKVPSDIKKNVRDTIHYLNRHEVDKLQKRIDKHGEREYPRLTVNDYDLLVNNQ